MPKRRLSNWVESFIQYTDHLPSPLLFRKWAAISAVSGVLERKVWVDTFDGLYPNLYVFLVGGPGGGKTVATKIVKNMFRFIDDDCNQFTGSADLTSSALIDSLDNAKRNIIRPQENPSVVSFNALKICSNELSSLLSAYEAAFMGLLTDVYDGDEWSQRRRTKSLEIDIPKPHISIVAATTPSQLNDLLPEGAWEKGFMSRVILVFSAEEMLVSLFKRPANNSKLWNALLRDLKTIAELYGHMRITDEAQEMIDTWHLAGGPPTPKHPKFMYYNKRRSSHLLKLCMISSASVSNELVVTLEHAQQALDWLLEAEHYMSDIFKAMTTGGDSRAIDDTWYYVYELWIKEKEPIKVSRVVQFLRERVPVQHVQHVLDVMEKAGILERQMDGYKPKEKKL